MSDYSTYEKITRSRYQDEEYAKYYKNQYAGPIRPANIPAKLITWRQRRCVELALGRCNPLPETLLDIPCGTGKLAQVLRGQPISVVGADISLEMIHLAIEDYTALDSFNGFVIMDAAKCALPDESFDCVICLALLHRVPKDVRNMITRELARVSRRYLITSYGFVDGFQKTRLKMRRMLLRNDSVPYPITLRRLTNELTETGLDVVKVYRVLPIFSSEAILLLEKSR